MKGGWFITGTDTGVGKTSVTEALLRALHHRGERAVGMKPVASGCRQTSEGLRSDDVERLLAASGIEVEYHDINVYSFEPAIAPHIAASQTNVEMQMPIIERQFVSLRGRADWIVVEGAGGWYVPFNRTQTLADLARVLRLPVILVVGIRLGCINHALLSARAIREDGLRLVGWVANHVESATEVAEETVAALDERLATPCLARIPFNPGGVLHTHGELLVRQLLSNTP